MIRIKRAYEPPNPTDGYRILIDRLWPRGISKNALSFDDWMKVLAPSSELRKEFGHDPEKWEEFEHRYQEELKTDEAQKRIQQLAQLSTRRNVTLLYAAKDEEHNNAVVLAKQIERMARKTKKVH